MKATFLVLSAALVFATSATAATAPGSFDVNTDVKSSCVLFTSDVNLGSYDSTKDANQSTAVGSQISVRCTAGTKNVIIALDQGKNATEDSSCDIPRRRLVGSNGGYLEYFIAQTTYHAGIHDMSLRFGCNPTGLTPNTRTVASFSSSLNPIPSSFGLAILPNQSAPKGSYTDTVGVTITF